MYASKIGQFGAIGESLVSNWLKSKGWAILPAYETGGEKKDYPAIFTEGGKFASPDMLIFKGSQVKWIEVKHRKDFNLNKNNVHTFGIYGFLWSWIRTKTARLQFTQLS